MRKPFLPAVCALLAFSFAACGGTEPLTSEISETSISIAEGSAPASEAPKESEEPSLRPALEKESTIQEGASPAREPAQSRIGSASAEDAPPEVPEAAPPGREAAGAPIQEAAKMKLNVQVGGRAFTASLEENAAVDAFVNLMDESPLVIRMSDYSGFEKVGSIGTSLPASNSQTTTHAGDIVLYNGDQIVLFYGSNSWSYTRIGKIDDLSGWEDALGNGDVTVTFSIGE